MIVQILILAKIEKNEGKKKEQMETVKKYHCVIKTDMLKLKLFSYARSGYIEC